MSFADGADSGLRGERMTNEEAIKLLLNIRKLTGRKSGERIAVDMAIEALLRVSRMDEEKKCVDVGMMSEGW